MIVNQVQAAESASPRRVRHVAVALTVWALAYAAYRGYYALGGQAGMIGIPASPAQFRAVNGLGAAVLVGAAAIPLLVQWNVRRRWVARLVPVISWVAAVGCCMHALVLVVLRVLSLAGVHATQYPPGFWLTIHARTADLQDLLLNEPWFLVEGVLWAVLGAAFLPAGARRRWWASVAAGTLLATAVGLLSGLGVIGSFRLG